MSRSLHDYEYRYLTSYTSLRRSRLYKVHVYHHTAVQYLCHYDFDYSYDYSYGKISGQWLLSVHYTSLNVTRYSGKPWFV